MSLPSFWTKPEGLWDCHLHLKGILSWPARYLLPVPLLCGEKIKRRSPRTKELALSLKGLKGSSSSRMPRKVTKAITPVRQQPTKSHSKSRLKVGKYINFVALIRDLNVHHRYLLMYFFILLSQRLKPKLLSPTKSQSRGRWKLLSPKESPSVAAFQIARQKWNGTKMENCWYPVRRCTRRPKAILVSWWLKRWRKVMLGSILVKWVVINSSSGYLCQVLKLHSLIVWHTVYTIEFDVEKCFVLYY